MRNCDLYNALLPTYPADLIRIGDDYDGGYFISKTSITTTKALIGMGVFVNWSFEKDFIKKGNSNTSLLLIDGSVDDAFFKTYYLKGILKFGWFTLKKPKYLSYFYKKHILNSIGLLNKWQKLLSQPNIFFEKKFVSNQISEATITPNQIFELLSSKQKIENNSVFVKMDIEGSEYQTLELFSDYYHLINGFAIEFHNIQDNLSVFLKLMEDLKKVYQVVFVHNNNFSPMIDENFSESLEITLLKKELYISSNSSISSNFSNEKYKCDPTSIDVQPNFSIR
jgi:hypothetical protein